jgi:hypothetical protein
MARAYADMKFVYVITCQIFGQQKAKKDSKADDILYLLKEYAVRSHSLLFTLSFFSFNVFPNYFRTEMKDCGLLIFTMLKQRRGKTIIPN